MTRTWRSTEALLGAVANVLGWLVASGALAPGSRWAGVATSALAALGAVGVSAADAVRRAPAIVPSGTGWKLPAFWLTLSASALGVVQGMGAEGGAAQIATFLGSGLAALGYQVGRGVAKRDTIT